MKTMKRVLALLLVCLTVFSAASLHAFAESQLYWGLQRGTLVISGQGWMPDYSGTEAPWRVGDRKGKNIQEIRVEDGVTHIGDQSFQYCEYAVTASIAQSVTSIGEAAFYNCKRLVATNLPRGLQEIDVSVFDHCSSLECIELPDGVEVIRNAAFNCCSSLEWIYIPASVTVIEDSAFNACTNLKTIYYGGSWSDWDRIDIAGWNKPLSYATIYFNCNNS